MATLSEFPGEPMSELKNESITNLVTVFAKLRSLRISSLIQLAFMLPIALFAIALCLGLALGMDPRLHTGSLVRPRTVALALIYGRLPEITFMQGLIVSLGAMTATYHVWRLLQLKACGKIDTGMQLGAAILLPLAWVSALTGTVGEVWHVWSKAMWYGPIALESIMTGTCPFNAYVEGVGLLGSDTE